MIYISIAPTAKYSSLVLFRGYSQPSQYSKALLSRYSALTLTLTLR